MTKSKLLLNFGIFAIAIITMATLFLGYGIEINTYAETSGPQISYVIDGSSWTNSKDITITISSVEIIQEVLINGSDEFNDLVSAPNDYYKQYKYTATSSEDIIISATDNLENVNIVTIQAYELFIDTTSPEFSVSVTGVANNWTSQNVTLTFTQSNNVNSGYTYYHSKNGDDYMLITGNSVTYSASSMNGEYSYKAISGSDITYNLLTTYNIKIDKTAPNTPSADFSTNYYTNLAVEFNLTLVGDGLSNETVYYTIDGSRPNTSNNSLTLGLTSIVFPANGSYSVRLLAIDDVGNEGAVRIYLVKVDSTDYVITFDVSPLGGGTVEGADSYKRGDIVELIATASSGYVFRDISLAGNPISYDNTYAFVIDGSGDMAYTANFIKLLVITCNDLTFTYDGDPKPIVITEDSGEDLSLYTQILYNGNTTPPTNAGIYSIVVVIDHIDYYGYKEFTLTINKAIAVIDVNLITLEQTYGNVIPVEVTITTPPTGTILTILYNGNTSLPVNVGSYPLTIIVNGDNYYLSDTLHTLEIIKADVSIVLNNKTVTYNNNQVTVNPATTIPGSLVLTYNYYEGANLLSNLPINAGTYTVQAVFNGNASYNSGVSNIATLVINKKQLTVTDTIVTTIKTYDGNDSATITEYGTLNGVLGTNDVSFTASATYNSKNVNANLITVEYTLEGTSVHNYFTPDNLILNDGIGGDVKINPRVLTISETDLTTAKTYDGNRDATVIAGNLTNLVGLDDVTVSASALYNVKDITADLITITYSIDGLDKDNYTAPTSEDIAGIINVKQLTVSGTLITQIKTYDGNDIADVTNIGLIDGVVGLEDVNFTVTAKYNTSKVLTADRINVTYTLIGNDKDNYLVPVDYVIINGVSEEIVCIDKLQLTAQYSFDDSKIYDGNIDAISSFLSFDNAITNDNVGATTSAIYNSKNVLEAINITISFTLDGDDKDNYNTPVNIIELGSITPLQIIMNGPTYNNPKDYDQSNDATHIITNNGPNNTILTDDILIEYSSSYNSSQVLLADTITTSYTISGDDKDNYITPINHITYDVEILPLQLTVDGALDVVKSKVYDSTTDVVVNDKGNLTGVLLGDTVDIEVIASYNSKNITATIINISYTLNGANSGNYIAPINEVIATDVSITTFALNIDSPIVEPSKIYDGNTTATVTAGALLNKYHGDIVNVTAIGTYNSKDVLTAVTVAINYSLTGDDALNYTLSNDSQSATITPRQLTMETPILTPKIYDGNESATSYVNIKNPTNKIVDDVVSIGFNAVYDDYRVATVTKVTVTYSITGGAQASNYSAPNIYEILNATINTKQLTASGTNLTTSKVYDGNDIATVTNFGTISGNVGSDIVTLSATAKYNSSRVPNANTITITYTISGDDASNYTEPVSHDVTSGVSITKLQLTIGDPTINLSKVYDGVTGTAVTSGELNNKIGSDSVNVTAVANYNSINITANTLTVEYTITGDHAENYHKPANKIYDTGVSITPLAVTIDYSNLLQTYDGNSKVATAVINNFDAVKHNAFVKTILYQDDELAYVTSIIDTGTYRLTINMASNDNYTCTSTAYLIISPAQSIMTIENVFANYNGATPTILAVVTNDIGDPIGDVTVIFHYYSYAGTIPWEEINWNDSHINDYEWTLIEGDISPTRAGAYKVIGSLATGSNYSAASNSALMKISKVQAQVFIKPASLTQLYGSVAGVEIVTNPATSEGNTIAFLAYYDGALELPENAGSYTVGVILNDYNYYGSTSGTFTITSRQADNDIVIENLNLDILGNMLDGFSYDYTGELIDAEDFRAYVNIEGLESLIVNITFKLNDDIITNILNAADYQIIATINDANISGIVTVNLVVNKVVGVINHSPQLISYTGTLQSVSGVTTDPYGVGLIFSYSNDEGSTYISTPPTNAGVYQVKLEIDDLNYYGEAFSILTIIPASTIINLPASITRTYSSREINLDDEVTFSEDITDKSITYLFKLNDVAITGFPINSGIYTLQISFINRDNFLYPDSDIITVTVNKAVPIINLSDTVYPYDGTAKTIPAAIIPSIGATLIYEYYTALYEEGVYSRGDSITSAPIDVGMYIVVARIEDGGDNYTSAVSRDAVLLINQGTVTINAASESLIQSYDGGIKSILIITDPLNVNVDMKYYQNSIEVSPIIPGVYDVVVTVSDSAYEGTNTFSLTILKQDIGSFLSFMGNTTVEYNGTSKMLTPYIEGFGVGSITTTYNGTATLPRNAGTYNVVSTINDNLYKGQGTSQLVITKKSLTIQANDITIQYGIEGVMSITYSGFVEGIDTASSLKRSPAIRISNNSLGINIIGFSNLIGVGEYEIKPENAQSDNYSFIYVSGTLTITKATLTLTALQTQVIEGVRAIPSINYAGWKYNDNISTVFGINRPIIKYYETPTQLSSILPTAPGIYDIIPDGGIANNYDIVYVGAKLNVLRKVIEDTNEQITVSGSFHPNAVVSVIEINRGDELYKPSNKAIKEISSNLLFQHAVNINLNIAGKPISTLESYEYRIAIPEKLQGKEFVLVLLTSDGEVIKQDYIIDGKYAVGNMDISSGTLIFAKSLNVMLLLIILGSIVFIIGGITLSKLIKKIKKENPKLINNTIAPVIVAPLEALEDEDAAFDAYIDKMVEDNTEYRENEAKAINKAAEDEIDLGINEDDYTPEEIQKLKEKARKAQHMSVEDRITQEVERQLVESFAETKRDVKLQEFTPAGKDELPEDAEITDEYIIENEMFPNSNTISMEEAQALYPERGIRRYNDSVALEVCFESALNLANDRYKYLYSEIKNTFSSFTGVESRMFKSGEAYKGGSFHAVIRIRNEAPIIFMNVDKKYIPEDAIYTDHSNEPKYKDMPIELIVDNGKQLTAARKMISTVMVVAGLLKNPDYRFVNYIDKYPKIENAIIDEA